MRFEIRPRQTEKGIVTDIYMDGRYISEDVIEMKIAANKDKPLHITLTFFGEIDFCCDDLTVVSRTEFGEYSQYLYMPQEKQPPQKVRKGLWRRLKRRE